MSGREKTRYGQRAIPWSGHWRGWYKLHRWQKLRRAQLRKQPLCEMCFKKGKIVAATVADHIVPHRGDWKCVLVWRIAELMRRVPQRG